MKKLTSLITVIALALSLTACSGDSTSGGTSAGSGASGGSSAASDASTPAGSEASSSTSDSEPLPEIPYTLGGELTPTMKAYSVYNEGNRVRLAQFIKKLQAGESVTVAYIGGSITQGTSAGNDLCYAKLTTNWIQEQFPDAKVNYVNAGIGATGSYIGVHRADTDVLSHKPDLVFVEFSVNDTTERTEINKLTYEGLLRKLWNSETAPAIVTIAMTQENGTSFQEYHGEIVKHYDLPMISYKNVILDVIDKGYIKWKDISDDNIHPNVPGHKLLSELITNYLQGVIDDLDSITGAESDFSTPTSDKGTKYEGAKLLTSANTTPTSLGCFEVRKTQFGGFNDPWFVKRTSGEFSAEDAIVFEVECKSIGLLYGKLTSAATSAEIYINDTLITTINADFTGGWGNYVEYAEIASFDDTAVRTIKIVPKSTIGGKAALFYISALAVS